MKPQSSLVLDTHHHPWWGSSLHQLRQLHQFQCQSTK